MKRTGSDNPPELHHGDHVVLQAPSDAAIADLARRLRRANSPGMQLLNLVGGTADGLFDRLPGPVRTQLEGATMGALDMAFEGAVQSRRAVADRPGISGDGWLARAVTSGLGAVGGAGGLASSLAELPVTTTILFHCIQDVAAIHGFDPNREDIRKACIQTFAAAGPLEDDDGADMAFLVARSTLTGATIQSIITRVAPRLSIVMGQKLAAQAVPILGAAAGAATNYTYTAYYQEVAHVCFGLLRLAEDSGRPYAELKEELRAVMHPKAAA